MFFHKIGGFLVIFLILMSLVLWSETMSCLLSTLRDLLKLIIWPQFYGQVCNISILLGKKLQFWITKFNICLLGQFLNCFAQIFYIAFQLLDQLVGSSFIPIFLEYPAFSKYLRLSDR